MQLRVYFNVKQQKEVYFNQIIEFNWNALWNQMLAVLLPQLRLFLLLFICHKCPPFNLHPPQKDLIRRKCHKLNCKCNKLNCMIPIFNHHPLIFKWVILLLCLNNNTMGRNPLNNINNLCHNNMDSTLLSKNNNPLKKKFDLV